VSVLPLAATISLTLALVGPRAAADWSVPALVDEHRRVPVAADPVVRVAQTDDNVDNVAAGGNRVFWTSWGVAHASVHAAGLTTPPRRLLKVGGIGGYDDVALSLWASRQRVAAQVQGYWSGLDDEGVDVVARATGAIGAPVMRSFESPRHVGFERLQDVAGDDLLSIAVKRVRGRWTVRAYVRADAAPRSVGPRLKLARTEGSSTVEGRITARWMALLRRRNVTVYDRWTGRPAWRVRLPATARTADGLVWDLGEDGTLAVAGGPFEPDAKRESTFLAFANEGRFRRVSRAVVPREPFVLRDGVLTYLRPRPGGHVRLYARRRGAPPRRLTGDLPPGPLASDGALVVAVVDRARGPVSCVLAAALPVPGSARWACP
jgi:hypothetical protein